jgi:hypothetical protein
VVHFLEHEWRRLGVGKNEVAREHPVGEDPALVVARLGLRLELTQLRRWDLSGLFQDSR